MQKGFGCFVLEPDDGLRCGFGRTSDHTLIVVTESLGERGVNIDFQSCEEFYSALRMRWAIVHIGS